LHSHMFVVASLQVDAADGHVCLALEPVVRPAATTDGDHVASGGVRHLVFDVETDGGRGGQLCVQLAFLVLDDGYKTVHEYNKLVQLPPGKRINPHAQAVHGISETDLIRDGASAHDALCHLYRWVDVVRAAGGSVVAHNAACDAATISNTARAAGLTRVLCREECVCTMATTKAFAGCVDRRGRPKAPSNAQLYEILHGAPPTWARLHDALDDVRVTARNFASAKERGWI
jgi:DNA polymerase III epsilon subunit-like protein